MRKNAALEASNVAVLLEHIPVGQTRSVHSLQVTRVEPDHYSIGGGRVVDLVDAISQIGQYTGHGATNMRSNPAMDEAYMRSLLGRFEAHLEHISGMGDRALAEQAAEVVDLSVPMMDQLEQIAQQTAGAKTQAKRAMHKKATDLWNDLYFFVNTEIPRALSRLSERAADVYETHDREQYGMRSNPRPAEHMEFAQEFLHKAKWLSQAGSLWDAYDTVMRGISQVEDAADFVSTEESQPLARELLSLKAEIKSRLKAQLQGGGKVSNPWDQPRAEAKIAELQRMQRLQEKREAKKLSSDPEAKSARAEARQAKRAARLPLRSNPQKAERGYFYEVMDKRGDVVMLTTTKAEAQDICANPAEYKLRKGGTFTFRHIGAQSALEGPPIRRI